MKISPHRFHVKARDVSQGSFSPPPARSAVKRLTSLVRKVRTFGLRGVLEQIKAFPRKRRLRRALFAHLQSAPPTRGVTVIAPLSGTTSLCKVMRDFIAKLDAAQIPHQTFDSEHLERNSDGFVLNRFSTIVGMLGSPHLPPLDGITSCEVIFWEFKDGVVRAYPHLLDGEKTILAMSDFNAACYRRELPASVPVAKVTYPLVLTHTKESLPPPAETREKFGIPSNAFVVFFNVGIGSNRKNPEGCIRAFAEALGNRPDACLVFKVQHARRFPGTFEGLRRLADELGIAGRFITITDYLSERDVYALTNACDVYLSLHRGEGFGLGVAEAMSLAKPAVVTDYSSTTEFCNTANAVPVPFSMVPPDLSEFDRSVYGHVTRWADPDIRAAARALRRLYGDPALRERLGKAAAASIARQFSTESFKKSMEAFLQVSREESFH